MDNTEPWKFFLRKFVSHELIYETNFLTWENNAIATGKHFIPVLIQLQCVSTNDIQLK